ncbi:hypothetical protein KUTeg_012498 [Tegillarca granosa]|uniref:Uncharacterized protein n=1 Tax=Tegillarca granosa TaxID=220873 RepID=A0ABQ9F4W5_TEGGR|nr:hypothetical protein KUTeg_012498 [Tegillarca granosa]
MRAKKGRYRLSPNEEAQLLKEETEKRRRLRILQVREQAKQNASKDQLEREKDEKVRQLETQYENCLRSIGHGQKDAGDQIDQDEERQMLIDGKAALEVEKNRAAQIAALPPPPPDPLKEINLQQNQKKLIKTTNADAFSTTYYHMSQDYAVDKADVDQQENARLAAEEEQEKIELEQLELKRLHNDRMARARVRHQHALQKEMLKHDYDKMMMDLSDLQRSDRDRRQKVVANIPKQVFEPPYKRLEDREDNQKVMEEAFEDMYMAETNYVGDISLALDPHPPPESSSVGGDSLSESGLTEGTPIPEPSLPRIPPVLRDMTNMPRQAAEKSPQKKPEKVLRKLMDKIKSQREEHHSKSVNDLPEHDVTNQPIRDDHIPALSEYTISEKSSPGDPHERLRYSPPEKQARVQKDILHIPTGAPTAVQPGAPVHTGKDTLMHPMETAAHIRQEAVKPGDEVYPGQSETKKTVDNIMEQQRQIEEQRRELEEKLKILEQQQRSLSGSLSMTTGTIVTSVPSTGPIPTASVPVYTVGAFPTTSAMINTGYPSAFIPPTSGSVHLSSAGLVAHFSGPTQPQTLPHQFSTGAFQPFTDTNKAFSGPLSGVPNYTKSLEPEVRDYLSPAAKERESPVYMSSLPMKTSWNGVPVSRDDKYSLDLSKVREYQNNLLTKHEHSKQILAQTRVEIERRRQELLKRFPQLDIRPMGASQFSSTAGLNLSQPGLYQVPDAGLKPAAHTTTSRSPGKSSVTNLVSSLASDPYYASRLTETKDGKQEVQDVSKVSKPGTLQSDSVPKPSGTKFDGIRKSLPFDVDDSLQESPYRINGNIVSAARSESEITTESDMSALKEDMDESAISSSTDRGSPALPGRRSGHTSESDSSLLSAARDRSEFFEKRQEDLKKQLREIQKQKDQIVQRHKVGQQKLQAQQDLLRDKMLYTQSFNAIDSLSSATNTEDDEYMDDVTSKQDPSSSKLSIPLYRPTQNLAEHRPHDLSTIQEVDTPRSARKSFGSGRPSLSSNTSSVSRRSLDFNQPSTLKPEEGDHNTVTPTERRIAGDTGYQTAKIDDIISKAREFNPAVMEKLKKQTNDIFSNLNDDSYRDDSLPQKSGVSGSFMSLSTGPLTPESMSTGPVDDTSMSISSQPASDRLAFKYVSQSGRDEGAGRPVNASSSFKSSWASELSSYTDKQRCGASFDSKTDGSFKYLKPSSDKSFDSEMSNFLQDGTQDSSGKFSNLEVNRGSGTDHSQKLQVDRSYDVLHLRDSSASEYYSLPPGLYGRKDSLDRKTLTDVSERPSSEDMSQYSLPDNYKSSDKFSEMSQYSLSDKTDSRVSVSARSASELRSSDVSGITLPSGKDSADFAGSINVSDKHSSQFTDNLSQISEPRNVTEKYSDLSQYTFSEKPDQAISVSDNQKSAAELSQHTMFSPRSNLSKDLPARQSPIGDFDISSSSAGKGKGDNEDYAESTTTWSEDATTPSSSHKNYKIERPDVSIEQRDKLRDEISDFSSKQISHRESVEKPTFGRKLDFTSSTPFVSDSMLPTASKFSDLSQYTISPDSSDKTESTSANDRQSLPFQSLADDKPFNAYSMKTDTPSMTELRREASSHLSTSSAASGSLTQYTSGFITKTPLSQHTIQSDTSINGDRSMIQRTIHTNEDPSLSQYDIQSDVDPSLSQYTINSDKNKQKEDLSLTQYSMDKTENNITHDAAANMSDAKGISSLSQYSITSEEDDSFVQKKFANLDQLILESRNLIEKHKELVSRNRDLEDKVRSRGSTPEKKPRTMDFQDGYRGHVPEFNLMDQSSRTSMPSTIQYDTTAGPSGLNFLSGVSNYSSNAKLPESSMLTGTEHKASDVSTHSADGQKEQETGITDEPDLTLVTVSSEVSMVEDVSQVSSGASEHGESVLSFEKHEQSLADDDSPRDDVFDSKKDLNLQEAFMLHKQRFMNAASEIRSRSMDEGSQQHDAGGRDIFRAIPVMVSPTVSLSMQFNSSQELKFNKPPVSWSKDEDMMKDKPSEKEQVSSKPAGRTKVPPPVPKKPQKPVPTERSKSLNKALQPRKSEPKKHAVVSPEKPGAISLGDLISSTKDLGPQSLKKTEVRKPVLSPRSFPSSSMKTSKPSATSVVHSEATSKKPAATGGALSKTLSSWKKSRAVKSTAIPSLPQKSSDLPSTGVKVLPKDKPPSMSSEEYESNMRYIICKVMTSFEVT